MPEATGWVLQSGGLLMIHSGALVPTRLQPGGLHSNTHYVCVYAYVYICVYLYVAGLSLAAAVRQNRFDEIVRLGIHENKGLALIHDSRLAFGPWRP